MTRIQGTARLEQNSYSERLEQYQEFNGLAGKNWLWGAGLGNYAMELQRVKPDLEAWAYQPIHNAWLVMIAEVGLLGVLIKLGFLLWRLIKRSNDGAFAFIILGSTSFMALFYHFWWSLWFGLLFLGFMLLALFFDFYSFMMAIICSICLFFCGSGFIVKHLQIYLVLNLVLKLP